MSWPSSIAYLCCIIFMVNALHPTKNYCDVRLCPANLKHVACGMNPYSFDETCSIDAEVIAMTNKIRVFIIKRMNALRNMVAKGGFNGFSAAANMSTVVWDRELAFLAEMNVRNCYLHYDPCRNTDNFKNVGQTVAYRGFRGSIPDLDDILYTQLQLWFIEEKNATMNDIAQYRNPYGNPWLNFMHLVHDKVQKVGCAVLQQSINGWLQTFFTCNYDHAPVVGQPVYHQSLNPGESCKSGTNPTYASLCSVKESQLRVAANATKKNNKGTKPQRGVLSRRSNPDEAAINNTIPDGEQNNGSMLNPGERTNKTVNDVEDDTQNDGDLPNDVSATNDYWRNKFLRFSENVKKALRKGKDRNVVMLTMNHEVDIDKLPKMDFHDAILRTREIHIQNAIENRVLPIRNRGISSRTFVSGPKVILRTQKAKHHSRGVAKWRTVRR
ncbi:tabinhibitin 3 [Drosophila montana]|uniref:tabinhibitin 3 n=1 Tax=Drosophila montana TaxID=40370 RepID=UPI00313D0DD5